MAEATLDPAATTSAEGDNNNSDLDNITSAASINGAEEGAADSLASLSPAPERNHAPGIPDRRKSVRPSERRGKGKGKISKQAAKVRESDFAGERETTPDIQVSMAEEAKVREEDVTPGEKEVGA